MYVQLVLADETLLKIRAARFTVPVSTLPTVGVCIRQVRSPEWLEVFPNGELAVIPQVVLPEDIALDCIQDAGKYILQDVAGWSTERVAVVSTLMREATTFKEAFEVFKVAEQLVP